MSNASTEPLTYPRNPPLECDVVLKGGITSGVLYPRLLCTLATTYRLRCLGGASAGAIAAAAAAAAEFGRQTDASGPTAGFAGLAALPDDITAPVGKDTVLYTLFQPQRSTAPLYRAFTAGLGKSGVGRWSATVRQLLAGFGGWAAGGAVLGVVVVVLGGLGHGIAQVVSIVAGAILLVLGLVVGLLAGVIRAAGAGIPTNGMGLCNGMPSGPAGSPKSLTPWLYDELQALAGLGEDQPLTFGRLSQAGITLRMMTTDLGQGQPLAMPWDGRQCYCFREDEFRALFPKEVIDEMLREERTLDPPAPAGYHPWPTPEHLPVIVATRMSLSFPILLSTVPLYRSDDPMPPDGMLPRHRFSDGGICSNLPIHFFDSPLPTCPTFAVDLQSFPPGVYPDPDEFKNSYLPTTDLADALRVPLTGTPKDKGIGAIGTFVMSIVNAARGWVDASHLEVPGSRDRVVTICHDKAEGGMNLNMPAPLIRKLAARGAGAGRRLVDWYAGSQPGTVDGPGWERHRWIRLRNSARGVHDWLAEFGAHWSVAAPGTPTYDQLIAAGAAPAQGMYPVPPHDLAAATAQLDAIRDAAGVVSAPPANVLSSGAPLPPQRLVLQPEAAG